MLLISFSRPVRKERREKKWAPARGKRGGGVDDHPLFGKEESFFPYNFTSLLLMEKET